MSIPDKNIPENRDGADRRLLRLGSKFWNLECVAVTETGKKIIRQLGSKYYLRTSPTVIDVGGFVMGFIWPHGEPDKSSRIKIMLDLNGRNPISLNPHIRFKNVKRLYASK